MNNSESLKERYLFEQIIQLAWRGVISLPPILACLLQFDFIYVFMNGNQTDGSKSAMFELLTRGCLLSSDGEGQTQWSLGLLLIRTPGLTLNTHAFCFCRHTRGVHSSRLAITSTGMLSVLFQMFKKKFEKQSYIILTINSTEIIN